MSQSEREGGGSHGLSGGSGGFHAPVVLILFNRPEQTAEVWKAIRQLQPKQLFVIADGPRPQSSTDPERCRRARAVTATVDWECEVGRLYADANLGCRTRVITGLDAVFRRVSQAIVLEDDCLVERPFFDFCATLLSRHLQDSRVWAICGSPHVPADPSITDSYSLSRYPSSWGWATWRRTWQQFDPDMTFWPAWKRSSEWRAMVPDRTERCYWELLFDDSYKGRIDTWDIPFLANQWYHKASVLMSTRSLVRNVGFGPDSTHTRRREAYRGTGPIESLADLQPPSTLMVDPELERRIFAVGYNGDALRWPKGLYTWPRLWAGQVYRWLRQQQRDRRQSPASP